MYPNRDFSPTQEVPRHAQALTQDLSLDTLLSAMTGDDTFLAGVARTALLAGVRNDIETVLYRQEIGKDCLESPGVVRSMYALAVQAIEVRRKSYWGYATRNPTSILYNSVEVLDLLLVILGKLRVIADQHAEQFASRGFRTMLAMLRSEFSDQYLRTVREHLTELRFKRGVLLSARLGEGNEGIEYTLRRPRARHGRWYERMLRRQSPAFTFHIADRDEAGARALSDIQNRGLNLVANAAAQATEQIVNFFTMLKTELAFYVCSLNLYDRLSSLGEPVCMPRPSVAGTRTLEFSGLLDVSLALAMEGRVVGNTINANGKSVIVITGANQGGKSSFLRSIGLSQLMMQCGMFVGAESFAGELCEHVFTHYKREEDETMSKGKLDEELSRLSDIIDAVTPNSLLLCNESFAATNEREGSEIASEVTRALLEKRIKIVFVTHLYTFAHGLFLMRQGDALFLRAERLDNGTRTFRLTPGEPLETSYGQDVYETVFQAAATE